MTGLQPITLEDSFYAISAIPYVFALIVLLLGIALAIRGLMWALGRVSMYLGTAHAQKDD